MQPLFLKQKQLFIYFLVFFLIMSLAGCSKNKIASSFGFGSKMEDSVESLAMKGLDYYEHGKYHKAKESFETLLNRYPFSDYSLIAELKVADSNYYLEEYEEAVLQYGDFEERHPTNEAIPYVMFQTGMCYYKQIDSIDRDAANATNAINSFSKLLRAFPNSTYQDEAMTRIKAARNFLANHEYYVANYYERTGAYAEAEARLEYLLKGYPESPVIPRAQRLLDALKSGNPPGRSLFGWMFEKLPDWEDITSEE